MSSRGAGISTETPTVVTFSLYDHVRAELEIHPAENLSFAQHMTRFEVAGGRVALLEAIKTRVDFVRSFPTIDHQAAVFTRSWLASSR